MERVQGPQTPFESYCFHCRVTFPVEAKRCIHCGGPLARAGRRLELGAAATAPDARSLPPEAAEEEMLEEGASLTLRRFGGLLIWALVAASALLSNLCQKG